MNIVSELSQLKKMLKNNIKSPFTIISIITITWFVLFNFNFEYKKIKINIIAAIVLSIIELVWWLIKKYSVPKNKTKKIGIGFVICSKEIEKQDIEKENFLKMLQTDFSDMFNILIYAQSEIELLTKHDYNISEIMEKLNLTILFEVKERKGNINNDNNYEMEIIRTTIQFSYDPGISLVQQFTNDFTKSVNKHIRISHKNSLIDGKTESSMIEISSLYIIAVINIVSPYPERSFIILDKLSAILNISTINKSQYQYIQKKLPIRYLEAYQNTITKLLTVEKYYCDQTILMQIKELQNNMFDLLTKFKQEGKIQHPYYKIFYENYLLQRAIIVYEEDGPNKALEIINKCDFSIKENHGAKFSKAFLLIMTGKINEGVQTYKKLFNDNNIEPIQIEDILTFIDNRQQITPENIYLKFCYAIINFYKKDKELALNIFNEIKGCDQAIDEQIDSLFKISDNS